MSVAVEEFSTKGVLRPPAPPARSPPWSRGLPNDHRGCRVAPHDRGPSRARGASHGSVGPPRSSSPAGCQTQVGQSCVVTCKALVPCLALCRCPVARNALKSHFCSTTDYNRLWASFNLRFVPARCSVAEREVYDFTGTWRNCVSDTLTVLYRSRSFLNRGLCGPMVPVVFLRVL